MQTSLYRFFGADGELLYVGITLNVPSRMTQHINTKPMHLVRSIHLEWFDSREEAMAAEIAAIQAESPLWNIVHQSRNGDGITDPKGFTTFVYAAEDGQRRMTPDDLLAVTEPGDIIWFDAGVPVPSVIEQASAAMGFTIQCDGQPPMVETTGSGMAWL